VCTLQDSLFFSSVNSFSEELRQNITDLSPEQTIQFNKALSNKVIDDTFDYNRYADLHRFIEKREKLIGYNTVMVYLFHLCQSLGILITSISVSTNNPIYIWLGIFLNTLATLISLWEKTNSQIMKKLMDDMKLIREGQYVDEGSLVEVEDLTAKEGKGKKSDKRGGDSVVEADDMDKRDIEETKGFDEDVEGTNTETERLMPGVKGKKGGYGTPS